MVSNLESWYLESIENAPFGALIHDDSGAILFFNRYLENLTGYRRDEIPNLPAWIEKIYPDESYRQMVLAERRLSWPEGKKHVREAVITAKDGRKQLCRVSSMQAASGIRTVLIEEMSGERASTAEGTGEYESLKLQFYSLPDPLLIWKMEKGDFVLTTCNKAAEALCGGKIADYLGKSIREVLENPVPAAKGLEKCIREKTTVTCDEPIRLPGMAADVDKDCTLVYLLPELGVMHISDRIELAHARQSLNESERRYRELVDMLPITIFEVDTSGKYLFLNKEGLKLLNCSPEELKQLNSVDLIVDADHARARENFAKVLSGVNTGHNEYIARLGNGREIPIILHSSRIVRNGTVVGLRGFVIDASERKKAEEALKKAYAEMESQVAERTRELQEKSDELTEVNTALRVLLRNRQAEREELVERIRLNAQDLILPYLEKLGKSSLSERQQSWLALASSYLKDLVSPLGRTLAKGYEKLTPTELQVADLIKSGKTSKEIAEILNIAVRTIESHRKSIRRKLGLRNQRINLQTHLSSL